MPVHWLARGSARGNRVAAHGDGNHWLYGRYWHPIAPNFSGSTDDRHGYVGRQCHCHCRGYGHRYAARTNRSRRCHPNRRQHAHAAARCHHRRHGGIFAHWSILRFDRPVYGFVVLCRRRLAAAELGVVGNRDSRAGGSSIAACRCAKNRCHHVFRRALPRVCRVSRAQPDPRSTELCGTGGDRPGRCNGFRIPQTRFFPQPADPGLLCRSLLPRGYRYFSHPKKHPSN